MIANVSVRAGQATTVDIRLVPGRLDEKEKDIAARDEVAAKQAVNRRIPAGLSATSTFSMPGVAYAPQPFSTEDYHNFKDNGFQRPATSPLSTFAIDVDAASYSNVRRFLTQGQLSARRRRAGRRAHQLFPVRLP